MRSHGTRIIGLAIFVLVCAPWLLMLSSYAPRPHRTPSRPQRAVPFQNLPVFSDFDGDNKLDQADLSSNGSHKRINVGLGRSSWTSLSFDSGGTDAGKLVSGDIDSDGDADLIWISETLPKHLVVWLGDGSGNFSITVPRQSEFRHFRSLLVDDSESVVVQDWSVRELEGVLAATDSFSLRESSHGRHVVSSTRFVETNDDLVVSASCLSALLERGPPSRLS